MNHIRRILAAVLAGLTAGRAATVPKLALVLAGALALTIGASGGASAAAPIVSEHTSATETPGSPGGGHAGRIVWTQVLNGHFSSARIVSARPDGSGPRALTHPGPKTFDVNAVISPDGSQVAFERDPLPSGPSVIGMVSATGRGEHIVPLPCASPCAGVANPSWTPDGRRIVFTRVVGPFDGPGGAARSAVRTPPARTAPGCAGCRRPASTGSMRTASPGSPPAAST
jgi:dipeptidyl aminopeptidase/acylaminoacyl peptidase